MRTFAHTIDGDAPARPTVAAPGGLLRAALNRFLVLPLGAAIALVWANLEPESYFRFAQAIAFPVNEIGMAIFLGLIAQELYEAMMPGGALGHWRHRSLPAVAALGGVTGALIVYFAFVSIAGERMLASAWPVVVAVDVAAGYYLLRVIYPRRATPVAFLLLTAVLTDSLALAVVTFESPSFAIHPAGLALLAVALLTAAGLRRRGVTSFWPYWLVSGTLSWLSFYWMGVHPALGLVPIVPLLPHDRRSGEVFADRIDGDAVHVAEHEWNVAAQIAVMLFGIANAGVLLHHVDTGTWAVIVAAVFGRPLGILAAVFIATLAGLHLPASMRWRDLSITALATTSGFTFALFLAAAALPVGAVAQQVKLGALLTVSGAAVTIAAAWLAGVGRFRARS